MSISPHPSLPKRRLGATVAVAGAALLTGLVVAFGPATAQGSSGSYGSQGGSGPSIAVPQDPALVTSGKAAGTAAQRSAKAEAFTTCMRENGVPDFPGVTVTANGTLQLLPGSTVNPISKTYQAAAKKCASELPSGSALPTEPSVPTLSVPAHLNIDCSGSGCPAAPIEPKAPALPN